MSEIYSSFAPESEAIRSLRNQLSDSSSVHNKKQNSVIKDPQSEAVRQLLERLRLGQS
jgi:hypothetical protein